MITCIRIKLFYVLICINNHIIAHINCMLSNICVENVLDEFWEDFITYENDKNVKEFLTNEVE